MTHSYRQTLVMPSHPLTEHITPLPSAMFMRDELYVLLRDDELPPQYEDDRPKDGRPQTVKFHVPAGAREMYPMDEAMQRFFTALTPDFPTDKMAQICDAFFIIGGKFYQGGYNIYTGEGEPGKWAKYPGYLGFGGDTVRCIGRSGGMLMIEAFNPAKLPAPSAFKSYADYEAGAPLKIALTTVNGARTNPFPHNGGKDLFTVLFSDAGYLLIEEGRCRKVETPERPYR